ncbi:MAG: hypothetical protein ACK5ME_09395 [Parahaliea sp.]
MRKPSPAPIVGDEYGAMLARWYADFSAEELAAIVPNLHNFDSRDLGFLMQLL